MRSKRRRLALAAALQLLAAAASAESLVVGPGPRRRPLFVELYRQSLYVEARYGRGLDARDAELFPGATAEITAEFQDAGQAMYVAVKRRDAVVAGAVVAYPPRLWDALAEVGRARKLAAELGAKLGPPPPPAAVSGSDLGRARVAYETFDLPSLVWAVNVLGAAQRGGTGDPAALRLMSASYAWLGRWLSDFPSERAKLFSARSLALAALAAESADGAASELGLALALCGRQADGLAVVERAKADSPELSALTFALVRENLPAAMAAAGKSRLWRWALALNARKVGVARLAGPVLRGLAAGGSDPAALAELLSEESDVSEDAAAAEAALELPPRLLAEGGFLEGRRPGARDEARAGKDRSVPDLAAFVAGVLRQTAGDASEEVPRPARARLLLDLEAGAAIAQMHVLAHEQATGWGARAFAAEARPLAAAHPWGFLIPLIREGLEKDVGAARELDAGLSRAPLSYGGVAALRRDFSWVYGFEFGPWLAARDAELDDLSSDDYLRAYEPNAPVALERVQALDPFDALPYDSLREATVDEGLEGLGDRPLLLRRKLGFARDRRPRDLKLVADLADRLLRFDPADWQARETKAWLSIREGKPLEAAADWLEVVRAGPGTVLAANAAARLSWSFAAAGDRRRARAVALAAAPAYSGSALLALAHAYEESGRYDRAEQVYRSVELRYGKPWRQPLLGKFLMRTGDPRGWGLVHAQIPKFFAHQQESNVVLTDEDHLELLDAFLMTEEWPHAAQLLASVLIPRWHPGEAKSLLWLAACLLKQGGDLDSVRQYLSPEHPRVPAKDPLSPVLDAFMGTRSPEEAIADMDLRPGDRSLGLYMLGLYYAYALKSPQKARDYFAQVLALRQYDAAEYYLARKELDRVPSYSERLWRQLFAQAADVARIAERAGRWWAGRAETKEAGHGRRAGG